MNKILAILFFIFAVTGCQSQENVRRPAVAGSFYPGNKQELERTVRRFLDNVPDKPLPGEIITAIAPHAGYVFSGQVAAYTHKLLAKTDFDTLVIIGHDAPYGNTVAFVCDVSAFKTPLGNVPVDQEMVKAIIAAHPGIVSNPGIHSREHTVEIQLPFLQVLGKRFKIVPILFGVPTEENCKILADAILKACGKKKVVLLASTDLCHYPQYEDSNRIDHKTLEIVKEMDVGRLFTHLQNQLAKGVQNLSTAMCSRGGVATGIIFAKAKGANNVQILKYANSGDVAVGNKSSVVGYGAAVISKITKPAGKEEGKMLNKEQRKQLLEIARNTIKSYLKEKKKPDFKIDDPELKQVSGVFVTLHIKGRLRGCIGNIIGRMPLWQGVRDMAVESAFSDPRFSPLRKDEFDDIDIEISVMSPLKKGTAEEIVLGTHGVIVKKGYKQGVFLPQVATETGWSKEEFLKHLCYDKAGLSPDAWKDKDVELHLFTAEVFGEKE